ncbi:hypothetical protein DFH06DRAFT_1247436 [Mycena polygramma]|nr:hypothetical protein DFH06DRAFT_1247436 [Mycena polygramma]
MLIMRLVHRCVACTLQCFMQASWIIATALLRCAESVRNGLPAAHNHWFARPVYIYTSFGQLFCKPVNCKYCISDPNRILTKS